MNFGETIPKGYVVEATSWENDGDETRTIRSVGLSIDHVNIIKALFPLFLSKNCRCNSGFGNTFSEEIDEYDFVELCFDKLKNFDKKVVYDILGCDILSLDFENESQEIPDFEIETYFETIEEFVKKYITGHSECYYFRVAEYLEVYFLPEDVKLPEVETVFSIKN